MNETLGLIGHQGDGLAAAATYDPTMRDYRPRGGSSSSSTSASAANLVAKPIIVPASLRGYLFFIAFFQCMGALEFGYNTAISSPAAGPIVDEFSLSTFQQEVFVSAVLITALFGALCAGFFADKFGRNKVLIFDDFIFATGIVVEVLAPKFWVLIIARFIVGLGIGVASVVVPLMVTEISPKQIRGEIGTMNQLCIVLGIETAYIMGAALQEVQYSWRAMLAIPALFCVTHFFMACILDVETPRWLALKGKIHRATRMLKRLRKSLDITSELKELQQVADESNNRNISLKEAFRSLRWRVLVISMGLLFFQQITGNNAIMYYMATFFQDAGMSEAKSNYVSILVGAVKVCMTIASVFLLDRVGRKPLLLIGISCMAMTLLGIASVFFFEDKMTETALGIVCVIFTILFVMGYACSLGCVPWIVTSEICSNRVRALVMSLALGVNWTTNFLVSVTFLSFVEATNEQTVFLFFSAWATIALIFVIFLVPETKGKTPQQIAHLMHDTLPKETLVTSS
ncbi:sugar porter family MFS transporter [Pelomyxa schiedti]|nr:sugar porter family MFS transporter [Pelomyxa schiedti]